MNLNDYQLNEEEREAAQGLMNAFAEKEQENNLLTKKVELLVNFISEKGLDEEVIQFMKEKQNEGFNYWYEQAAETFLNIDVIDADSFPELQDEYEISKGSNIGYLD
ncbi:hypothetical protein MUN88_17265 [Gracilibacillus caseinilyticus]|uniref:Post-transcriptional regulator n=1 Tax=Gracilibacillus caseinilyticus TaxID=2932256 RepID=A0ABY4ETN6_9BACI|nr:hypothetical protein [Gracilibacillus caseinilyticus]UOQ47782.1 hypothetical protein MUN88_17265 [Gracilibacillus caseinilyticus]